MTGAESSASLPADGDGHLSEDTVMRLLAGNLRATTLQVAERHLQHCAECLELLAAVESPAGSVLPPCSESDSAGVSRTSAFPVIRARPQRRIGQYELYDCLGEGGMGIVYRAWATEDRRWVAIKQVRMLRPAAVESLRREIHALRRVDHPGVVQVFDQGIADGLPWYAMEFIEGDTLNGRLRSLPGVGALTFSALIPALRIIRRLCQTLAFLHGEGIVHRDLAPKNVILQHRDRPVLVDFGLASLVPELGREGVHLIEGGTPWYMAPEQIDHELVDARADLYALGCILYETFTGDTPFPRRSATDVGVLLRAIAGAPPPPPPVLPGLPTELQEITMSLLARRPGDRCGYALDVARALERSGVDDSFRWNDSAPRPHLYRPGLVARTDTLEQVNAAVADCARGRGGCAVIAGESGIGKTRILLAAAASARAQRLRVVAGGCTPPAAGVSSTEAQTALGAFRPLLQVIADSCRQGGPPLRERLLAGRTDALATFEPGLRELPGAGTEPLAEPEPPPSTAEAARFRLFEAMLETLRAFAQAGTPLVLIIDDLQWLDDLSQAFIERLDRTFLEQNAILLLGSYRSDEVQPGVRTHLAQLGWSQELARLGREEIGRMVGDMLAVPSSTPELVDTLARLSNGNPYFVTEYVRMAVEGGWLAREPGSPWLLTPGGQEALDRAERLPTPTSLAAVLAERLRYLSEPTRELARFAAVLGNRFTLEELQRGLGPPASGVLESVSDMLRGQMLASARDHSLEFVHERLRQAALASVPPAALPGLHRTAALTLESGANAGDRLGDLAHHWHQAGDPAKEREYRGPAGERAFRVGAYADAIAHLERALALRSPEEDRAETVRLQRHLAEAYFGAGDMVASRRWIEALATRAGLPLPVGRWATGLTAVGDIAGALARHALRPLLHSRSPARRRLLADVAGAFERLAHVMFFENELVGVTASSLRALGAASRLGPSPELARVYANLSISAALIPLHDVARGLAAEARQIALDINDAPALTWTRQLDGVYLAGLGEFADARASFEQALASWQTIGDRRRWEETLTLLGMCLFHAGELSEAARIRQQLERAGRDSGNRQTVGWALIGNAEDLLVRGEVDGAVGVLEQARTLGPFVRRVEQVWMHAMLARACHLRGEYDRAHQAAEEARQRLARSIPTAFYVLEGYSALAEVYRALADRSTGPERRQLERHAREASRALAGFTRVFPFSQGRRRLSRGMQLVARGKLAAARGLWAEAAGQATRDRRVLDAALLWRALAQHPAAPDQVDSEAQRQAATWMARAVR